VEEATDNLVAEAVDEEFSADIDLIDDLPPILEDIEEPVLALKIVESDEFEVETFLSLSLEIIYL
jgi:hypothetical protein